MPARSVLLAWELCRRSAGRSVALRTGSSPRNHCPTGADAQRLNLLFYVSRVVFSDLGGRLSPVYVTSAWLTDRMTESICNLANPWKEDALHLKALRCTGSGMQSPTQQHSLTSGSCQHPTQETQAAGGPAVGGVGGVLRELCG